MKILEKLKRKMEKDNFYKQIKKEEEEWEKIRDENMKRFKEYAEHFDGYGNVKCEYCEVWVDVEFMGKQCPVCNAEIPIYKFEKIKENRKEDNYE